MLLHYPIWPVTRSLFPCRRSRKISLMWTVVSICGEWSAILSDSLVMLTYLYTCREAGIACTKSSGSTNALDTHRTELLSLLIVCFSESLYYSQEGKPLCKLMCWSITCVVCCLILQRKSQTTSGLHTSHPLAIDTYYLCSHPC